MPPSTGGKDSVLIVNLVWWNLKPTECFEREWIRDLLATMDVREIVAPDVPPRGEDAILVANFSRHLFGGLRSAFRYRSEQNRLREAIQTLRTSGRRIGLLHLGDECFADSTACYRDVDFVFRQYHRAEAHSRSPHCHYLPLGYTAGFAAAVTPRPMRERRHVWFFAGQGRRTRRRMITAARSIPGGAMHLTSRFADPSGIDIVRYAQLMGDAQFALCPIGNCSVECLRLYEALEAGAIPIVETHRLGQCIASAVDPRRALKYGPRDPLFCSRNYQYWERAYPGGFPCLQISRWSDLPELIATTDPEPLAAEIRQWWSDRRQALVRLVTHTIEATFH